MEDEKFIDESWKESVEKEKQEPPSQQPSRPQDPSVSSSADAESAPEEGMPEVNFIGYTTSLAFQTMIFLGEIPNPMTNETDKNLAQAKFLIDTLVLLREKTKGNLNNQESDTINGFIYELQMKFVEARQKEGKHD